MKKIVVGITGASGSIYAKRLIEELLEKEVYVHLICTDNGRRVMEYELALDIEGWCQQLQEKYIHFQLEDNGDLFAAVASGSYRYDGVVILPCSMGTLAEISNGLAKSLLCRAADVALKESRQLILVLSLIHI